MNEKMRFSTKSPEKLQAQTELYADQGVKEFSDDQRKLLQYSAELAKITDFNHPPPNTPPELLALVTEHKDRYLDFLRREKDLETSFIESNTKLYKEKFSPVIRELKQRMAGGDFKKLPEYLGSGSNGSAFRVEVDGIEYAAKFSRSLVQSNFEIKPLLRAQGIPHTAQLVAYSFEDGVVIMNLLEGKDITQLGPDRPDEYPEEHIIQLIETIRALDKEGIVIDPKPSNFIWDSNEGFSLLDFHLKQAASKWGLPQEIMSLRNSLSITSSNAYDDLDYKDPDYAQKRLDRSVSHYKIALPKLLKFLHLLAARYPEILSAWKKSHEELKNNPMVRVSELVDRNTVPDDPELKPYLDELTTMGF